MPKFKVVMQRTSVRESAIEDINIDEDEWKEMTEDERNQAVVDKAHEEVGNHFFDGSELGVEYEVCSYEEIPKLLHKVEIRYYAEAEHPSFATEVVEIESYGETFLWAQIKQVAENSKYADTRIPNWHFRYDVLSSVPLEVADVG